MAANPEISPFQRLVCASAGRAHGRAVQVMALDNACAHIARQAREPIMAQIRLAWWRDGLTAQEPGPEHRAPDLLALRAMAGFAEAQAGLIALVDGWEELIVGDDRDAAEMLTAYAAGRGAGLFGALAAEHADRFATAGAVWALWDLAGHLDDAALKAGALTLARSKGDAVDLAPLPRPLAMMAGVALGDVRNGKGAPPHLTPGLYMRLLRLQILGR